MGRLASSEAINYSGQLLVRVFLAQQGGYHTDSLAVSVSCRGSDEMAIHWNVEHILWRVLVQTKYSFIVSLLSTFLFLSVWM